MLSRRLLGVSVCLSAFAIAQPAIGSPFVGTYRGAETAFTVDAPHRVTYNFDVTVTQAVASSPKQQAILLDVEKCVHGRCTRIEHSAQQLPDGAVSIDPTLTKVTARALITQVNVHMAGSTSYASVGSGSATVGHPGASVYDADGPSARTSADMSAPGIVALGSGLRCHVTFTIFSFQGADAEGDDVRDPHHGTPFLPRSMTTGAHRLRC